MQDAYLHPPIASVTLSEVLHALSDPLRLSVMAALHRDAGRGGCGHGWGEFDGRVSPSTLSHHMKVLRMAGLTLNRREGTRCLLSLRPEIEERFPGLLAAVLALRPEEAPVAETRP